MKRHLKFLIGTVTLLWCLQGHGANSPPELTSIFNSALNDSSFNKSYSKNGCFVRAHWLAAKLYHHGLKPQKIFLRPHDPSKKMHIVLADGTTVGWAFHVAAAFTDSDGTVWIIDPILAKSVITVTEWQKNIQQQNIDVQIEALATGPEIYNLVPEAEAEWQNVIANKPFSEAALDFITEAMADLFYWETFKD